MTLLPASLAGVSIDWIAAPDHAARLQETARFVPDRVTRAAVLSFTSSRSCIIQTNSCQHRSTQPLTDSLLWRHKHGYRQGVGCMGLRWEDNGARWSINSVSNGFQSSMSSVSRARGFLLPFWFSSSGDRADKSARRSRQKKIQLEVEARCDNMTLLSMVCTGKRPPHNQDCLISTSQHPLTFAARSLPLEDQKPLQPRSPTQSSSRPGCC